MSSAACEIWTRDGHSLIGYGNYHGTSDVLSPGIVGKLEDWGEVGGWDALHACECDDPVEAWAYSWYGGGFHWPVSVCNRCWVVIGPLGPYEPDWGYAPVGYDDERRRKWHAEVEWWRKFRGEGWPKHGPPPGVADMDAR